MPVLAVGLVIAGLVGGCSSGTGHVQTSGPSRSNSTVAPAGFAIFTTSAAQSQACDVACPAPTGTPIFSTQRLRWVTFTPSSRTVTVAIPDSDVARFKRATAAITNGQLIMITDAHRPVIILAWHRDAQMLLPSFAINVPTVDQAHWVSRALSPAMSS